MSYDSPDARADLPPGERVVWIDDRGQPFGRGQVIFLAGDVYAVQLDGDAEATCTDIHRSRLVREATYPAWLASLSN